MNSKVNSELAAAVEAAWMAYTEKNTAEKAAKAAYDAADRAWLVACEDEHKSLRSIEASEDEVRWRLRYGSSEWRKKAQAVAKTVKDWARVYNLYASEYASEATDAAEGAANNEALKATLEALSRKKEAVRAEKTTAVALATVARETARAEYSAKKDAAAKAYSEYYAKVGDATAAAYSESEQDHNYRLALFYDEEYDDDEEYEDDEEYDAAQSAE